jgi:YVTN family beta-propeller protein
MDQQLRRRAALGRILLACALLTVGITISTSSGITPVPEANAATFAKPTTSSPITISADNKLVWSVSTGANAVTVIRTSDNTVVGNIAVDREPRSVAVDPNNGFAYVANAASSTLSVIRIVNADPNNFQAGVDTSVGVGGKFTTGAEPWDVVISPDGNRVFVSNSAQDTITIIDATTRKLIGSVDLRNSPCNDPDRTRHFQPRGMAVSLDNSKLFVTRFIAFTKTGGIQGTDTGKEGAVCQVNINTASVSPSDFVPFKLITLGPVDTGFKNPDTSASFAFPNQLQSIVIRGNRAFLPNIASSPSGPLKFNVDTQAFMSLITTVNTTPVDGTALNLNVAAKDPEPGKTKLFFANLWGVAFTTQTGAGNAYAISAGSDLLVKLNVDASDNISFTVDADTTRYIDLHDPNNPATSGVNAGKNPLGIVINEATKVAYVNNFVSRNVSVVDLNTDTVTKVVKTANLPAPGSQGERNLVGAEMFFSSRGVFDRPAGATVSTNDRLSAQGWQNCASCHFDGWTDGTTWTFNAGPRKAIPLNGAFDPNDSSHQRILNYSANFDEVQDFEANIRNVSGPGALAVPLNGTTNDPNQGLLIGDDGNVNNAPTVINAFALPNAGRPQLTVTLPGSNTSVPSLDALKEWVQFAVRTPTGRLTTQELLGGGGSIVGGANPSDVAGGRELFVQAGCATCHGGGQWTTSVKDFTAPPPANQIFTETNPPAPTGNPVAAQYLDRFLRNIGSFNLGVAGKNNNIGSNIGAPEIATGGLQGGLGFDFNNDGHGNGFNVPSLLGIGHVGPYYHNGSCETLACVLTDPVHRTGNNAFPDKLIGAGDQLKVVAFLETIDKDTQPEGTGSPAALPACSPRPPVSIVAAANGPGKILVTVTAANSNAGNNLKQIKFNTATNATITAGGQPVASGSSLPLNNAATFQFNVQRIAAGAANVPLVVTDGCGDWPSFVGIGAGVP